MLLRNIGNLGGLGGLFYLFIYIFSLYIKSGAKVAEMPILRRHTSDKFRKLCKKHR